MDVESFISANAEKYKTISYFQNLLNTITEETYSATIEYVKDRINFFFKDRESSILFLNCISNFSIYNYQQFSLVQDVCIQFLNELKQSGIDELDLIDFNIDALYCLNYLYDKKVISIESIYRKSIYNLSVFINFYPEIDIYDHEYALRKKDDILNDSFHIYCDAAYFNFLKVVLQNIEDHKKNRKLNFHPSLFHKSIREDDIESFQSILSKNNYSINYRFEKSYYERALTEDKNPSLIQVAAVYGSLKIFKFLWMQPKIEITENLIDYAVSGRNFEIIHICEIKCPLRRSLIFSIASHQNELNEYIIENSEKSPENNENDDDDDNIYSALKYSELKFAINFLNYEIIIPCLKKIVSITKKYVNYDELEKEDKLGQNSFFSIQIFDMDLFRFLFENRNPKFDFFDGMNPVCFFWLTNGMFDAIKYMTQFFNPDQLYQIFEDSVRLSPNVSCFLMDLQFDEIKNKKEHPIYDSFKQKILGAESYFISYSSDYFDADVLSKELNLYYVIDDPEEFLDIISVLSEKMRNSLFKNKLTFSSKEKVVETANLLKNYGFNESAKYILEYNQ